MADVVRRTDQYSPKSSPRGSRSPVVSRQDTTGTLKTTISLGKTPAIVHSGPFYLMKEPPKSELTGATNLMVSYGLEHSYNKFSGRKVKDQLSAFLPNLPGNIDAPGDQDNSSLRSLIEKPPVGGKELLALSGAQLVGFRLHPGPLPEQYRMMSQQPQRKKHKHKKHKHKMGDTPNHESQQQEATFTTMGALKREKWRFKTCRSKDSRAGSGSGDVTFKEDPNSFSAQLASVKLTHWERVAEAVAGGAAASAPGNSILIRGEDAHSGLSTI
ncbi:mediator of RNA polymerase II transcription subunit 19 [Ixodes scapularis]